MASVQKIVTTGTGASDYLNIVSGNHTLLITASSWGSATLQEGADDTFFDCKDMAGNLIPAITANAAIPVVGGMCYRLNVTSHAAAITVTPRRS